MKQVWSETAEGQVVNLIDANALFIKPRLCGCGIKHLTIPAGAIFHQDRYWFHCECGNTLTVKAVVIPGVFVRDWIELMTMFDIPPANASLFRYCLRIKSPIPCDWTLHFKDDVDMHQFIKLCNEAFPTLQFVTAIYSE